MILGISGTGRKNSITYKGIESILKGTNEEYEIISLNGKKINGCIACLACTKDNRCKVKDDFQEIQEKMLKADVIVFGAADYFGMLNSLAHATLERTFAFRHNGKFSLEGKKAVIVTTSYKAEEENDVYKGIKRFFDYNRLDIIDSINLSGYSQCYGCTSALKCSVGNVVKDNGYVTTWDEVKYPKNFNEQEISRKKCLEVSEKLKLIIKNVEK